LAVLLPEGAETLLEFVNLLFLPLGYLIWDFGIEFNSKEPPLQELQGHGVERRLLVFCLLFLYPRPPLDLQPFLSRYLEQLKEDLTE